MTERLQTTKPEASRPRWRRFLGQIGKIAAASTAAGVAAFGVSEATAPTPAEAAAYADSVSAPQWEGDTVVGRANVNKDCEGTVGCWSYVKIEYRQDTPGMPEWLKQWKYIDGHWAQDGENTVSVPTQEGCGQYRMVVDSYNDMYGEQGSVSVGAGVRGMEVGIENVRHGVNRLHLQAVATSRICNIA